MDATKQRRVRARRRCGALIFAALAMLTACKERDAPPGRVVVALESMPHSLDPRFAIDAASSRIGSLVFRSLTRADPSEQRVPDLALDWKLDSSRVVTFTLRRDARFQDGTPVLSADVRATYESILDPSTASPKRQLLEFLEAIETPDDHTIRFRMKEPYAPFLEATGIGILPRSALEATTDRPLGAGPFRIASVEPGHEVRLTAAPDHAGLAEIVFRVIPDDTVRALEVKKGTVHFVQNGIEPENLWWLRNEARLCVTQTPGTTVQYLGINVRDAALSKLDVRQAIAHAIDRDALVTHLLSGSARPATGLLAPGHWAYTPDVPEYGYDPALARQLLDRAAYPDPDGDGPEPRLRLTYKTTTLASRRRVAEALQAMLAEVGVALDVRSFEWGTFYDDIRRGNFQLYGLAWVGIGDPDFFFGLLASEMVPPRGNNRGGFSDPEIDRLTRLGRITLDPTERQRIYHEVQRAASLRVPFVPLWWEDTVVVRDRRLCGFVPSPSGDLSSLRTAWWNDHPPESRSGHPGPCGCASPRES